MKDQLIDRVVSRAALPSLVSAVMIFSYTQV